jgi:hypothetical protein
MKSRKLLAGIALTLAALALAAMAGIIAVL